MSNDDGRMIIIAFLIATVCCLLGLSLIAGGNIRNLQQRVGQLEIQVQRLEK